MSKRKKAMNICKRIIDGYGPYRGYEQFVKDMGSLKEELSSVNPFDQDDLVRRESLKGLLDVIKLSKAYRRWIDARWDYWLLRIPLLGSLYYGALNRGYTMKDRRKDLVEVNREIKKIEQYLNNHNRFRELPL